MQALHSLSDLDLPTEQRRLTARLQLSALRQHERLAENIERLPTRTDLSPAMIQHWRDLWRNLYEVATGVPIERRHELRLQLQAMITDQDRAAADVIDDVRHTHLRRFGNVLSDGGSSSSVGGFEEVSSIGGDAGG